MSISVSCGTVTVVEVVEVVSCVLIIISLLIEILNAIKEVVGRSPIGPPAGATEALPFEEVIGRIAISSMCFLVIIVVSFTLQEHHLSRRVYLKRQNSHTSRYKEFIVLLSRHCSVCAFHLSCCSSLVFASEREMAGTSSTQRVLASVFSAHGQQPGTAAGNVRSDDRSEVYIRRSQLC